MRFDVLTLFPEMFPGYLGQSLLNRAIEGGIVDVQLHNLRNWAKDKHKQIDDRPFGGGPGMVLMAPPVVDCVEEIQKNQEDTAPGHLVLLSPQGRKLTQTVVEELADHERLVLLCGRYEGFDHRINELLQPDEISVGDFVLNGGEVAAMVLIDAVLRLVPGVLGDEESRQDSFTGHNGQLQHEQYTRPREYRGISVPEVLLSGNHEAIANWRAERSRQRTQKRRSDLLD